MRPAFHVTYEIVTTESSEHGDVAESGYAMPGGWQHELKPGVCGNAAGEFKRAHTLTLKQAFCMVGCMEDSGQWFTEIDGRDNYKTGAHTRYSLHPPHNITAASYGRLRQLLGI